MRSFALILLAMPIAVSAETGKPVLHAVSVEGLETLPPEAVARATGLVRGQPAENPQFDAACQRLMDTGMFLSCQYKWQSTGTDVSVTFEVGEQEPDQKLRIDIPGVDEGRLWEWAKREDPLLRPVMPGNTEAGRYYVQSLERYLKSIGRSEKIVSRVESDIENQAMVYVFRPEYLPRVVEVRFKGNTSVATDRLVAAFSRVALDSEYSEFQMRRLLALNVSPLYEEQGRLDVRYTKVEAEPRGDSVVVTTTVEEGPVYQLAGIELRVDGREQSAPEGFPTQGIANWRAMRDAVDELLRVQRNEGYISARAKIDRTLDRGNRTAVASIDVDRGVQWLFGKLIVKGLEGVNLSRALEHWNLKPGAPMCERCANDYVDRVLRLAELGPTVHSAGMHLEPRQNTNVMDVVVTFR